MVRSLLLIATTLLIAIHSRADIIPITVTTFVPPTGVTSTTNPVPVEFNNGFSINGLQYTVTATSLDTYFISWSASKTLQTTTAGDLFETISGNTDISATGGTFVSFSVLATAITSPAEFFYSSPAGALPAVTPLTWNNTGLSVPVAAGQQFLLSETSGVSWIPSRVGDTLTVSSQYTALAFVPEPSAIILMITGVAGLAQKLRSHVSQNS